MIIGRGGGTALPPIPASMIMSGPAGATAPWGDDGGMDRGGLIRTLRAEGIGDERLLAAMADVPRPEFVSTDCRGRAWGNHPLPIGFGQTISQPLVVAIMIELAAVGPGDRVLDVGTGSGYQAAVLAQLGCAVSGVEVIPQLAQSAGMTLRRLGYDVDIVVGDGHLGRPDRAPFDAIIVAAAADEIPQRLVDQLRAPADSHRGGRLVVPVSGGGSGQTLVVVERTADGVVQHRHDRVRFVPFV